MFPCLKDNYGFLLHDPGHGRNRRDRHARGLAASSPRPTPRAGRSPRSGTRTGTPTMPAATPRSSPPPARRSSARRKSTAPRPRPTASLAEGDTVKLGCVTARVIDTPGHTLGHIVYHLPEQNIAFVGDTLFALGCGRLFEGTARPDVDQPRQAPRACRTTPPSTARTSTRRRTRSSPSASMPQNRDLARLRRRRSPPSARRTSRPSPPPSGARKRPTPSSAPTIPKLQAFVGHPGDVVATFAEVRERKNKFWWGNRGAL